jgi:ADP-heptose:LPS heptosyltransferase
VASADRMGRRGSGDSIAPLEAGKTVVLCLDTLGDLTLRQPLFSGLLDHGFQVTVVVRRGYETIVPFLDRRLEALVTDVNPNLLPGPATVDSLEDLRRRIDERQPGSLVSALYDRTYVDDWLLDRFAGETVGLARPAPSAAPSKHELAVRALLGPTRSDPFTRPVACREDDHESQKNNALLRAMTGRAADPYVPTLSLPEEVLAQAREALKGLELEPQRYVFGCPAGTARTLLKAWPAAAYAELVEHLGRKHRLPVLLTGIASEAPYLAEVAELCGAKGTPVRTWIGDSARLGLLLGLIRGSRLYLGADTGPMHFAGALGVPVVACFGGGHWPRFLPLARPSFVGTQDLPCFGCGWECWLGEPMCISRVSVQPFKDAVDWILSGSSDERRVDTGETLSATTGAVLQRAAASKREAVDELKRQLDELNAKLVELNGKLVEAEEYRKWIAAQFNALDEYRKRVEADSMERLAIIEKVAGDLAASESDRAARGQVIEAQARLLRPFPVRALLKILGWLRVV